MMLLANDNGEENGTAFINPLGHDSFGELFQAVTRFIFWVIVAIFPIVILVAAIQFFGAGDDPKKVESAKNIIKWAIIGFAVVLSATALYNIIRGVIDEDYDPDAELTLKHQSIIKYI